MCSDTLTLTDPSGEFEDGYPLTYPDDLSCGWIIDPPGDDPITLEITYLYTDMWLWDDWLRVYDGMDSSAPLLGEYSGYQGSTSLIEISTNGIMFVEFTTDSSGRYPGFTARYMVSDPSFSIDVYVAMLYKPMKYLFTLNCFPYIDV